MVIITRADGDWSGVKVTISPPAPPAAVAPPPAPSVTLHQVRDGQFRYLTDAQLAHEARLAAIAECETRSETRAERPRAAAPRRRVREAQLARSSSSTVTFVRRRRPRRGSAPSETPLAPETELLAAISDASPAKRGRKEGFGEFQACDLKVARKIKAGRESGEYPSDIYGIRKHWNEINSGLYGTRSDDGKKQGIWRALSALRKGVVT